MKKYLHKIIIFLALSALLFGGCKVTIPINVSDNSLPNINLEAGKEAGEYPTGDYIINDDVSSIETESIEDTETNSSDLVLTEEILSSSSSSQATSSKAPSSKPAQSNSSSEPASSASPSVPSSSQPAVSPPANNPSEPDIPNDLTNLSIMGTSYMTADELYTFYMAERGKNTNPQLNCTVKELIELYLSEGAAEGVRGDVAFYQAIKETSWFTFPVIAGRPEANYVKKQDNNFCGLGVTGTAPVLSFPTPQIGVRAHIQHLKAYASKAALNNECVDPRFKYVSRGCAPRWYDLSGKWAADPTYGEKIIEKYTYMLSYQNK